jgi:hypothetical protein
LEKEGRADKQKDRRKVEVTNSGAKAPEGSSPHPQQPASPYPEPVRERQKEGTPQYDLWRSPATSSFFSLFRSLKWTGYKLDDGGSIPGRVDVFDTKLRPDAGSTAMGIKFSWRLNELLFTSLIIILFSIIMYWIKALQWHRFNIHLIIMVLKFKLILLSE